MSYYFSKSSASRLESCHEDLIILGYEMIQVINFTVLCGTRGEKEQNEAFDSGKSGCRYPDSYHNSPISLAFDVAPYPIDWDDLARFSLLGGIAIGIAAQRGIDLEWGGTWGWDFGHFQLRV